LAEPLDLGLAFADAGLVALVADLAFALTAAAFAATFTEGVSIWLTSKQEKPAFLVSVFVLVVFLATGFFTVAAFLVVVAAFFVGTGFFVVGFSVDLVLLAGAFFAGAAFVFSVAFLATEVFLGG
jgi:hypothetical protein